MKWKACIIVIVTTVCTKIFTPLTMNPIHTLLLPFLFLFLLFHHMCTYSAHVFLNLLFNNNLLFKAQFGGCLYSIFYKDMNLLTKCCKHS